MLLPLLQPFAIDLLLLTEGEQALFLSQSPLAVCLVLLLSLPLAGVSQLQSGLLGGQLLFGLLEPERLDPLQTTDHRVSVSRVASACSSELGSWVPCLSH
ncbi:hypothetical protein D3C75_1012530 [compost metagenome]